MRDFLLFLIALNVVLAGGSVSRAINKHSDLYLCIEAAKVGVDDKACEPILKRKPHP